MAAKKYCFYIIKKKFNGIEIQLYFFWTDNEQFYYFQIVITINT